MMRLLAGLALALLLAPAGARAQVAPDARWRTLETEHFRVTYGDGLEPLARHAAARAELARDRLAAELAEPPRGKVDIVLTDDADFSNGMATPLPSNRIVLFAKPPVDNLSLNHYEDWLDLVVVHELVHIFHLDAARGISGIARALLGRVPAPWPFFPALSNPGWAIEGLATYYESRLTGAGRVHGSYHDMVLRTAILEDDFDSIDRVGGARASWPGGARAYIYGSLFADWLARTHGPEAHRAWVDRMAGAIIPPFLSSFDRFGRQAFDASFSEAFRDWRAELEERYGALAAEVRARGLTEPERLTGAGYHAYAPRVGPDGRVAYVAADGRDAAATRVLDPESGADRRLARRNDLAPAAWLPDGALLTSQLEFDGPYRIRSDLFRVDGSGERRLTRGARLLEPDPAPDGRSVVAVRTGAGASWLVVRDLETGRERELTAPDPDVHWAAPRWSPDGARLAAARWEDGMYDVVVLDTLGRVLNRATADRAIDAAPAWSPDGRYVLFSSDRSGIPNLYAYDLRAGGADAPLRQVTNLLTGAFHPDVSPDGRWIYFSGYHADGFHIERVPFDPGTWRAAEPVRAELAADATVEEKAALPPPPEPSPAARAAAAAADTAATRPYSPMRSLLPRHWLPLYEPSVFGGFYGAAVSGSDLVGRHGYTVSAAIAPEAGLEEASLGYRWAGLGNPVLWLEASRSWDGYRPAQRLDGAPDAKVLLGEDALSLSATMLRRRFRSSARLTLGGERIRARRGLVDAPGYRFEDPTDDYAGAFVRASFTNAQRHAFSISREDGVALAASASRRWHLDAVDGADRSYDEASAWMAGYRGVRLAGFADHVLALRASARWRGGPGAYPFSAGGADGASLDLYFDELGGPSRFLPVRGYDEGVRAGTRGWSASLEYRLPIALVERGLGLWPAYLDRLSGALFLDAGDAWCAPEESEALGGCTAAARPLLGAGAELAVDASLFSLPTLRVRGGVGVPLAPAGAGSDDARKPVLYFGFGPSF